MMMMMMMMMYVHLLTYPHSTFIIHLYSSHNMVAQASRTGISKNTTNEKADKT